MMSSSTRLGQYRQAPPDVCVSLPARRTGRRHGPLSGATVVILGNGNAALAVARNAYHLGAMPLVLDSRPGPATVTSLARVELCRSGADAEVCARLRGGRDGGRRFLIATDDSWLDFLARHRERLEPSFEAILHPSNDVLLTCLSKRRFGEWCQQRGFPSPRLYSPDPGNSGSAHGIGFPVIIRPEFPQHRPGQHTGLKATQAHSQDDLRRCLDYFARNNIQPVITESLLGHRLRQYSVGVARGDGRLVSFVAEKMRPWPGTCGVGTYVVLRPDGAAESLARRAVDALDYYGIAEVEILRLLTTGQDYLIEINARPWRQYALAPASGHDFLRLLLDPAGYQPNREVKAGKQWIDFRRDLAVCFARRNGLVRHGKLSMAQYLLSLWRANVYPRFSMRDPLPSCHGRRWLRRHLPPANGRVAQRAVD